jgi:hypothetical protein
MKSHKNILISIFFTLCFFNSFAQTTTKYTELNTGVSTGIIPLFPGASYMIGATTKYPSGVILDYEGGIAIPSIVTGKGSVGLSIDENLDLSVGIRPWPASTFVQMNIRRPNKSSNIVLTAESMMWSRYLWVQNAIFTIGWRWNK